MPLNSDAAHSTRSVQEDESEDDMYPVIEILAERNNKYQVRWEGNDPATGRPWPPSWIPKEDASEGLVKHWEKTKAKRRRSCMWHNFLCQAFLHVGHS
jgi:hypothetical protein